MKFRERFHRGAMCLNFADALHIQLIDLMAGYEEYECKQMPSNEPESYCKTSEVGKQIDEALPTQSSFFSSLTDIDLALDYCPFVKAA